MRKITSKIKMLAALMTVLSVFAICGAVFASQDDNSLYSLGINTEGVTVEPEFVYSTWEYDVTVPAGTAELSLSPIPSSEAATIADVSGTTLDENGNGTVVITVRAGSGATWQYTLNVKAEAAPAVPETSAPEPETEAPAPQTEAPVQTEPQTEDSRYVKVDRNTIQAAEDTITSLKGEITQYRETVSLYTKIMYCLIGLAVLLLFLIINLILRKRDLKAQLKDYENMGYPGGKGGKTKKSKKEKKAKEAEATDEDFYQAMQQRQPYYGAEGNLDVTPQTSSGRTKKQRNLPAYEDQAVSAEAGHAAGTAPQNQSATAGQSQSAQQAKAKSQPKQVLPQPEQLKQTQAQTEQPKQAQNAAGRSARKAERDIEVNMIDL